MVEQLGAEMLLHFGTSAPPIVTEDMREAIDDEDAFEELQRQAREGGQVFTGRFEPDDPPKVDDLIDPRVPHRLPALLRHGDRRSAALTEVKPANAVTTPFV